MVQNDFEVEIAGEPHCVFNVVAVFRTNYDWLLTVQVRKQSLEFQIALLAIAATLSRRAAGRIGSPRCAALLLRLVVLSIEKGLTKLRGQAHARRWEAPADSAATTFTASTTTTLFGRKVQRHGDVAHENHAVTIFAIELNEDVLTGKTVFRARCDDRVGDAIHTHNRNTLRFSVKRVVNVHLRHN